MKIYTKTGDAGMTGLFGGPRVSKTDPRICAYGSIDELNAVLGVARAHSLPPSLDLMLGTIQHQLFSIGAELATPNPEEHGLKWHGDEHVLRMEEWIDSLEGELAPLRNFILPEEASKLRSFTWHEPYVDEQNARSSISVAMPE